MYLRTVIQLQLTKVAMRDMECLTGRRPCICKWTCSPGFTIITTYCLPKTTGPKQQKFNTIDRNVLCTQVCFEFNENLRKN